MEIDSCLRSGTTFWCNYSGGVKPYTWRECVPGEWEIDDVLFSVWHENTKYTYALKRVIGFSLTEVLNSDDSDTGNSDSDTFDE
jgi:hypothetical protein